MRSAGFRTNQTVSAYGNSWLLRRTRNNHYGPFQRPSLILLENSQEGGGLGVDTQGFLPRKGGP